MLLLDRGGQPYGSHNVSSEDHLADASPLPPELQFVFEGGGVSARAHVVGFGRCLNAGFYTRAPSRCWIPTGVVGVCGLARDCGSGPPAAVPQCSGMRISVDLGAPQLRSLPVADLVVGGRCGRPLARSAWIHSLAALAKGLLGLLLVPATVASSDGHASSWRRR